MRTFGQTLLLFMAILLWSFSYTNAQNKLDAVGGFEGNTPAYWQVGSQPSGATVSWATDQFRSMGHSLKIDKSATSDSASWISDNMCDLWAYTITKNVDILLGAYVKTQGVNTNPTSEDQKWYVAYTFYDSAGNFMGETKLPIDQSQASSTGWMADTNAVGETILPKDAWKCIVSFVAGKNATGTVWADDFILVGRGGAWAGQTWDTQVGVPSDFYYWMPPVGGNDGQLNAGFENTVVTDEAAHTGKYSLKFDMPLNRESRDGFVSTHRMPFTDIDPDIKPGDVIRISVWIKASGLYPDSAAKYPSTWAVGVTPQFFPKLGNHAGFDGSGDDYQFTFPNATSFGWMQFHQDVQVPTDKNYIGMEVRLHIYSTFVGTVYFDDLTVEKLPVPQATNVGGFEATLPSYWNKGNEPTGTTLTWATDQYKSMGHSLEIQKTATGDSASWISENMCDNWAPTITKNVDILLGAYVKTQGVNTNPANDDEKWYVSYSFYDSTGAFIGETKLPIDQSQASSTGWIADTNAIGETILPKDAWKCIVSFVAGKNATGTVWADDFILVGRGGAWAGQTWDTQVGVPTGWYYWLPPVGGNDGQLSAGFENTVVTNEAAHSGQYSLKFVMPIGRETRDGFVGTRRYYFDGRDYMTLPKTAKVTTEGMDISHLTDVQPGDSIRISVWVKASGLYPDSAAKYPSTWAVGVTPQFFTKMGNNAGFDGSGDDYQFTFPNATSFDWTKYYVDVQIPADTATKGMGVRLHVYSTFAGTVYFDDLSITKITGTATGVEAVKHLPTSFKVYQNYPNPFNPTTTITYALPKASPVKVIVYDIMGRQIKTMVNGEQSAGIHTISWNGENNFGEKVSSGTYIYRISAGNNVQVKKMVLLK